ncbi:MAG: putative endonuclease [Acidobacteriota bacterium]|nr:putative endonuclease [Acidobacteriota bacterium]
MKIYCVYILASIKRVLYVGVTGDIERRLWQHRLRTDPSCFTARYNVDRLVYIEEYSRSIDAIAREKEIKGWRREKKVRLIEDANPSWRDLSCPTRPDPSLRSG